MAALLFRLLDLFFSFSFFGKIKQLWLSLSLVHGEMTDEFLRPPGGKWAGHEFFFRLGMWLTPLHNDYSSGGRYEDKKDDKTEAADNA